MINLRNKGREKITSARVSECYKGIISISIFSEKKSLRPKGSNLTHDKKTKKSTKKSVQVRNQIGHVILK